MLTRKIAFVFPGQGSQAVGMGEDLSRSYEIARKVFSDADKLLNFPISQITWNGPADLLNDTINTQPALLSQSTAVLYVIQEYFPTLIPAYVAGHSMGEISALVAAKALSFSDALKLLRIRGELMKQAGINSPGGMAAIIGMDIKAIEEICNKASIEENTVQIANDNCPGQIVISGTTTALTNAIELAKRSGARRIIPLNVSIAAHSILMKNAQMEFGKAVDKLLINEPFIPIIGNVNAKILSSAEEIRGDLKNQLTSPVQWTKTIQLLIALGVSTFLEIGNGSVLCGLIKRIDNSVNCISVTNPQDIDQIAGKILTIIDSV